MINRTKCDLCCSGDLSPFLSDISDFESELPHKTDLLQCQNCYLIQQNYLFNHNEISSFYDSDYNGRNYNSKNLFTPFTNLLRSRYYSRFTNLVEYFCSDKDAPILDYGSGDGFFLELLRRKGFKNLFACDFFEPTEINSTFVTFIHPQELALSSKNFSVVTMINSIEHLSSFKSDFKVISKTMLEGSKLIIETPNIDSLDFYIFKKYWGGLHQPRHTFLWSKSSISRHLANFGFSSYHLGSPQPAHWAISIQNILSSLFPFTKKLLFLRGRIKGYVVLVILFLPIGFLQFLFKKESVLNIVATKDK